MEAAQTGKRSQDVRGIWAEQDSLLSKPHGRHSTMEPQLCLLPAMDKEGSAASRGSGPFPSRCFCQGGKGSPHFGVTCSLWTFSLSSIRTRSPSANLDCSSCICPSSFFFLYSTSCLAWLSDRISLLRSALPFSSVCLVLSRLALA